MLFEGFDTLRIQTSGSELALRRKGSGPGLLLLHGYPQTHAMWHHLAPRFADRYSVVCPDLRGYGDSGKPATDAEHAPYGKRAMAQDCVEIMQALGFERFAIVGHDRGGRVAYRLALDHPERVAALSVLDILPTSEHFERTDKTFALRYFHWFFLAQPFDLPERLIGADPDAFYMRGDSSFFHPDALAAYRRAFRDPATIHAMCEDYRAAATIDLRLDQADKAAGKRIRCPLQALWGKRNLLERCYDVLGVWREWAEHVEGAALASGHYLAEEAPEETYAAVSGFLSRVWP